MSRIEIPENATKSRGTFYSPLPFASVQVNVHGGGPATVFEQESGGVTLPNPLTSDSSGRIEGYLNPGLYDLVVSHATVSPYTQTIGLRDKETEFRVDSYDAAGGIVAYDKPAIAAAIADAVAVPGGTVVFSRKQYLTDDIFGISRSVPVNIRGEGWGSRLKMTTDPGGALLYPNGAWTTNALLNPQGVVIRDLFLIGPGGTGEPTVGVGPGTGGDGSLTGGSPCLTDGVRQERYWQLINCRIQGFRGGRLMYGNHQGGWNNLLHNNYFHTYWCTIPVTTLTAAITTTGQTSITVASAAGFPTRGTFVIEIDSEKLLVTAGHGTTTWTVTRGHSGTTAATHSNGASVKDPMEGGEVLGDQQFYGDMHFRAARANWAVGSRNGLQTVKIIGGQGGFSPVEFYRETGPLGGVFMQDVLMLGVNQEKRGNAFIYAEDMNTAYDFVRGCTFGILNQSRGSTGPDAAAVSRGYATAYEDTGLSKDYAIRCAAMYDNLLLNKCLPFYTPGRLGVFLLKAASGNKIFGAEEMLDAANKVQTGSDPQSWGPGGDVATYGNNRPIFTAYDSTSVIEWATNEIHAYGAIHRPGNPSVPVALSNAVQRNATSPENRLALAATGRFAGAAVETAPGTTLSAAIVSTSATSISVTSAAGFPKFGNFLIFIDAEFMLVTAGHGTTTWTVVRGQEGTTAATHLISATVLKYSRILVATPPCVVDTTVSAAVTIGDRLMVNTGSIGNLRATGGYTSGSDSIASGSTSKVVSHSHGIAPNLGNIRIAPTAATTSDPGHIWWDTPTATQFTVHCTNNPGASGLAFNWWIGPERAVVGQATETIGGAGTIAVALDRE